MIIVKLVGMTHSTKLGKTINQCNLQKSFQGYFVTCAKTYIHFHTCQFLFARKHDITLYSYSHHNHKGPQNVGTKECFHQNPGSTDKSAIPWGSPAMFVRSANLLLRKFSSSCWHHHPTDKQLVSDKNCVLRLPLEGIITKTHIPQVGDEVHV